MDPEVTQQTPADKAAEAGKGASTPTPTPPSLPKVELTIEEYQRLTGYVSKYEDSQRQHIEALDAKEREKIKALTDKGEIEKAIEKLNQTHADKLAAETQKYADLERQTFAEKKAAVIAQALAGKTFVSPAAQKQTLRLLEDEVEVFRDGSGKLTAVHAITRKDASAHLKELLDSEDYGHQFAATNTTGGAGQQGNRAGNPPEAPKPGTLADVAATFKAAQGQYASMGLSPLPRK